MEIHVYIVCPPEDFGYFQQQKNIILLQVFNKTHFIALNN